MRALKQVKKDTLAYLVPFSLIFAAAHSLADQRKDAKTTPSSQSQQTEGQGSMQGSTQSPRSGPAGEGSLGGKAQPSSSTLASNLTHTSISFAPGASTLASDQKANISQLLSQRAATAGEDKNTELTIAVWSDKEWRADGTKFSQKDKELVEARADAIRAYVKEMYPEVDLKVHKMIESASFFAKVFNTDEAKIKSLFAKTPSAGVGGKSQQGEENNKIAPEARIIKELGGPSKAVLVLPREEEGLYRSTPQS